MLEADGSFLGTGTGIVSIVLSALKAARLGETPREGQIFATDLGSYSVPPLDTVLMETYSICDTTSFPQYNFKHQIFYPALRRAPTTRIRLG